MVILMVLSLLSLNSANLFARRRIDMRVETPLIRRRIPLEVKLFTGDAIKVILFNVQMTVGAFGI